MFVAIKATMAAGIVLAAAAVPNFDVGPSCHAAAARAASPDALSICRSTEQKARDEVVRQWPQLSAADKQQCIPTASLGGRPTYTELLTCLELARDVRQLHSKTPPGTTRQSRE